MEMDLKVQMEAVIDQEQDAVSQRVNEIMNAPVSQEQGSAGGRRKKLWQVKSGYYCSLIGICLGRADLHQIARKKIFALDAGLDAFALHKYLSSIASKRYPKTRALHKLLDNKYRAAIKRYSSLEGDEAVRAEWQKDMKSGGAIPGAYWAIMTLPSCGQELLDQVYGDCHMISYDIFSAYSNNAKVTAGLRKQIETLRSSLEKTKSFYQKERDSIRWELNELQKSKAEYLRQRLVSERLVKENKKLKDQISEERANLENNSMHKELEALQEENIQLRRDAHNAAKQSKVDRDYLAKSRNEIEHLEVNTEALRTINNKLKEEIVSLESMFQLGMVSKAVCDSCEGKLTNNCQGIGLSGKAVLYVGGRNNMIAHYREMVEKYGGIFLHHDGGMENSRSKLPKMLSGADVVLCPIDCVSHDACKCLKKICKRSSTPFVMMRSAGLSSLAKELETILQ